MRKLLRKSLLTLLLIAVGVPTVFVTDSTHAQAPQLAATAHEVVLGSSKCPVVIYPPTTDWTIPYTYADGVSNTAKLNALFEAWGDTGAVTGVVKLPPGVLYTVGTVFIPRSVSVRFEGSGIGLYYSDVTELNRADTRWHMEKATGAGAFCPGVFAQNFGLHVQHITFSSRRRRLTSDAWLGTPPSQMWYIAPQSVGPADADYITWTPGGGSPIAPSTEGGGTGKHTFEFCFVQNSTTCPFVQTCHVSRPASLNADTVTLRHIQHFGSGPLVLSASEQNVKLVIDELYFEGFDTPNVIDSYKVAGVSIYGGTLAHACTLVKLRSEVVGAEPLVKIDGLQIDNNATPTTVLFDGWDATSNQTAIGIHVTDVNFPTEDTTANGAFFKISSNQHLTLTRCTQVKAGLFATKNQTLGYAAYGESAGYVFRPGVTIRDCQISQYAKSPTLSLITLRHAASSTGAAYYFESPDRSNYDPLNRWFPGENLDVAP